MVPEDWITTSPIRTATGPGLMVRVEGRMVDREGRPVSMVEVRIAPVVSAHGSAHGGYVALRSVHREGLPARESSGGPYPSLQGAAHEAACWVRDLVRPAAPPVEPGRHHAGRARGTRLVLAVEGGRVHWCGAQGPGVSPEAEFEAWSAGVVEEPPAEEVERIEDAMARAGISAEAMRLAARLAGR